MSADFLTRNEAAQISGVSLSAVNKAVEQRVVKPRRVQGQVFLALEEAPALRLLSDVQLVLPISSKRRLRDWLVESLPLAVGAEFALSPVLRVAVSDVIVEVLRRASEYVRLREQYIESNPKVMGGAPVIRGTRVPVRTLAAAIESGESREALREDYPHIPEEAYDVAVLWSKANPKRGRPVRANASRRRSVRSHRPSTTT